MLTSCVFFLAVKEESLVPPSMGQVIHAFFLDRVRAVDPAFSEELHSDVEVKPFTISPLWGRVTYQENRWRLYPGEAYSFRITSMDSNLSKWLLEKWAPSLPAEIVLAGARLKITGWTVESVQHEWAGVSSYEQIYNEYITCDEIPKKLSLYFHSPTTFRARGNNYPLPDPKKVFLNLLHKWNTFSPIHLGDNFSDFIEANVFPSMYKLQTRIMHFDNYKQVGFTGNCHFAIRKQGDDILVRVTHMLAKFAFFAGFGYKTTMGMGQGRSENA